MYNSLTEFYESGTKSIERIIGNYLQSKSMNFGELVMELEKPIHELLCAIIKETIEDLDKAYREDEARKKKYHIERKDRNSILTSCGVVEYTRTYFRAKDDSSYVYLADKAMGIEPKMRKSEDVTCRALEASNDSSYRLSGLNATHTDDSVSKQTVMNDLHRMDIPWTLPDIEVKKKQKTLYIAADEDHVSLQFKQCKGDLNCKNGYKSNTLEPKLAVLFEGISKESPASKRNKLLGKYHFGGVYKTGLDLWEEVQEYIEAVYDEESIESIYIIGDGASWIKAGVQVLGPKCKFVLDQFHLKQYIYRATNHLFDSAVEVRQEIYDAIDFEDQHKIKKLFKKILTTADSANRYETIVKAERYIMNNWKAIIIRNSDNYARVGGCAEGQISHVFSTRLSRDPMGWSRNGADKMARLRVFKANGGKVIDLIKYKQDKQKWQVQEAIRLSREKLNKAKIGKYTDAWKHSTITAIHGKRTGLYHYFKMVNNL